MRNLDFDNNRRFQHDHFYWNYRMGGLQAALGLSQVKNLKNTISNKIKQGKIYNNFLESLSGIQLPLVKHKGSENHYWVYGIVLKSKSRDDLSKHLYDMGIQTRNFFWPLHLQSALPEKYYSQRNLPVSEHIGKNGLYLPLGEHLKENDQRYISKCIRTFMEE